MVGQMGPHEKLRTVNTAGWALCTKSGGELCDPTLNYPLETCSLMGPTKSTKHHHFLDSKRRNLFISRSQSKKKLDVKKFRL